MTRSAFDNLFVDQASPVLMEHLGMPIVYMDAESDPVTVTGIVSAEMIREEQGENGIRVRHVRHVTISTDTTVAGGGVASPNAKAEVEIDGVRWAVEAVESFSGGLARLTCVRLPMCETSKPGYRGKR